MKKIAVFFPGRRYSVDCPLLYFSDFVCNHAGYERAFLHYDRHREEIGNTTIDQDIENAKNYVINELKKLDFSQYDEVLFVSKSIGTTLAGYATKEMKINNVRNIYLTPLPQTLQYIDGKETIVVAGTKDRFLDKDTLKNFCEKYNVKLYQMEGLGHSLETDDLRESLDNIYYVSKLIEKFISK